MANTERSDVAFELKEFGDGTPWLMVNFDNPRLSCIKGNDILGLQFRNGVTLSSENSHDFHRTQNHTSKRKKEKLIKLGGQRI